MYLSIIISTKVNFIIDKQSTQVYTHDIQGKIAKKNLLQKRNDRECSPILVAELDRSADNIDLWLLTAKNKNKISQSKKIFIKNLLKNHTMTNTIKQSIINSMQSYNSNDYMLYVAETGWQEWMNDYTTAQEDEMASEQELAVIENIQRELWMIAHGEA